MAGRKTSGMEIELRGVSFRYGEGWALEDLDLVLPAGRVTAVVGPSGAGKSTLLQLVAGLEVPEVGDVLFDGVSVLGLLPEERDLGVVFQSYALFPHLTVRENVAFGLEVRRRKRREVRSRVAELLERLEIGRLAERRPAELSGGERQRVALARALAFKPRAVLLDEPLAALDARLRLHLRSEIAAELRREAVTALYVTHDREEAMVVGDQIAVLRAGRLEQVGTAEELYRRPANRFVARFFGEGNFLPVEWRPEAGELRGSLGTWEIPAKVAAPLGPGGPGELLVRPEGFRPSSPERAHLAGRVSEAIFLGDRRRVKLETEAGLGLEIDLPPDLPIAPRETLHLELDLASAVFLAGG